MNKKIKNPQTQKEEFDKIIDSIEGKETLKQYSNAVNVFKEAEDKPSDFTFGTDFSSDWSANQESTLTIYEEMKPYSKDLAIDESDLRKNNGMKKTSKEVKI